MEALRWNGLSMQAEGRNMLDRIAANSNKLGKLIDDILEYSRTGRLPLNKAAVDLDELVAPIADGLRTTYPRSTIDVKLLPVVLGDATMLRQIFDNLLGNACKFSSGREHPLIEVGSRNEKGVAAFYVKDNGVGFDMQYTEKLFGIFQRLHKESEFPGTGVGLSIVKQLVERHGGQIWYESRPDGGATFFFTLG